MNCLFVDWDEEVVRFLRSNIPHGNIKILCPTAECNRKHFIYYCLNPHAPDECNDDHVAIVFCSECHPVIREPDSPYLNGMFELNKEDVSMIRDVMCAYH